MELFLTKSLAGWELWKGKGQTGEARGGKYVARVQVGYAKDGSPKYRYFETQDEYESYLQGKGKKKPSKESAKKLKEKTEKEHKESKKKQSNLHVKKKKNAERRVKKSVPALYIEVE